MRACAVTTYPTAVCITAAPTYACAVCITAASTYASAVRITAANITRNTDNLHGLLELGRTCAACVNSAACIICR